MKLKKMFVTGITCFMFAAPAFADTYTPNDPASGPDDPEFSADVDLIKLILQNEVIRIVEGNFDAAERENGEFNKLVRALSGVSVADIEKYGVCGGTNSEVRKLFGSFCN